MFVSCTYLLSRHVVHQLGYRWVLGVSLVAGLWRGSHWSAGLHRYRHCVSIISISCCVRGLVFIVYRWRGHRVPVRGIVDRISLVLLFLVFRVFLVLDSWLGALSARLRVALASGAAWPDPKTPIPLYGSL